MNAISAPSLLSQPELRTLLLAYRRENWRGIQTPEWQERIVDDLVRDDGETVLRQLADHCRLQPGSHVLDVGSGVGSFVIACRQRGLAAFGVEPDRIGQGGNLTSIQIASRRLQQPAFASAVGEKLPFPDQAFDLVTMNQVIEHVHDQVAVLHEGARVLKHGGALYVACPNYLRFYEPHYKVLWFPLLPKPVGRVYLRLRGRNPVLLDQLKYTTNSRLRRLLRKLGTEYTVIDLHREQFLKKCENLSFASPVVRLVGRMTRLRFLGSLVQWAVLLFLRVREGGCEMLVLRKPGAGVSPC